MDPTLIIDNLIHGRFDWWVYAILVAIPFSALLAVREGFCWFYKQNKLINRIERLDDHVLELKLLLSEQMGTEARQQGLSLAKRKPPEGEDPEWRES